MSAPTASGTFPKGLVVGEAGDAPVQQVDSSRLVYQAILSVFEERPRSSSGCRDDRYPAGHGLDGDKPEGLVPLTGEHQDVSGAVDGTKFGSGMVAESDSSLHRRQARQLDKSVSVGLLTSSRDVQGRFGRHMGERHDQGL